MTERPAIVRSCAAGFADWTGRRPHLLSWAPGRINVLGGHTDYNGGLALPGAIDRWMALALRPRTDARIRVRSADFDGEYEGTIEDWPEPTSSWQRFVRGLMTVFVARHPLPTGIDVLFAGDVPHGAGLSSSAALTVSWMNALRAWTAADIDDWELVRMCRQVENEHLGVRCGLLDPVASHMARAGHLLRVDFRSLEVRQVPVRLPDVSWVVLHSGVRRELASSAYSDRVRECAEGLAALRVHDPSVEALGDLTLADLQSREVLCGSAPWVPRVRHVVTENDRVERAVDCLSGGDVETLGALLTAAHASLRDDYRVSCPELDGLVELATADPACWGARMVGGGFGGCTLNLVASDRADAFIERTLAAYRKRFRVQPRGFRFRLVGGASVE